MLKGNLLYVCIKYLKRQSYLSMVIKFINNESLLKFIYRYFLDKMLSNWHCIILYHVLHTHTVLIFIMSIRCCAVPYWFLQGEVQYFTS
jgi:hypothetical protein